MKDAARRLGWARLHHAGAQAFVDVFGEYAGWAHNALFISELAAHKHLFATRSAPAASSSDGASESAPSAAGGKADAPGTPLSERRGSSAVSEASVMPPVLALAAGAHAQQDTPTSAAHKRAGGAASAGAVGAAHGNKAGRGRKAGSRVQPLRKARRIAPQQPSQSDSE